MQPVGGLCSDTQRLEMVGVFAVKCWCCMCLTGLSCSVCHQIVRALEHLHSKLSVIHRGRCWLGFVWCGWSANPEINHMDYASGAPAGVSGGTWDRGGQTWMPKACS